MTIPFIMIDTNVLKTGITSAPVGVNKGTFLTELNAIKKHFDTFGEAWEKLSQSLSDLADAWQGKGGTNFSSACECITANYYQTLQNLNTLHVKAKFAYDTLDQLDVDESRRYRQQTNLSI